MLVSIQFKETGYQPTGAIASADRSLSSSFTVVTKDACFFLHWATRSTFSASPSITELIYFQFHYKSCTKTNMWPHRWVSYWDLLLSAKSALHKIHFVARRMHIDAFWCSKTSTDLLISLNDSRSNKETANDVGYCTTPIHNTKLWYQTKQHLTRPCVCYMLYIVYV